MKPLTLEQLARALGGTLQADGSWLAHCPAHDDADPSFSLTQGSKGVIFCCRSRRCDNATEVIPALIRRGLWMKKGSGRSADPGPEEPPLSKREIERLARQKEKEEKEYRELPSDEELNAMLNPPEEPCCWCHTCECDCHDEEESYEEPETKRKPRPMLSRAAMKEEKEMLGLSDEDLPLLNEDNDEPYE